VSASASGNKPREGVDDVALETDLGWAIRLVSTAFSRVATESVAGLPGGPRGYLVLVALAGGEPPTQLALAKEVSLDRTVMTYLLDDLEAEGLIERLADPSDRRVRRIAATAKGRARLTELGERLDDAERQCLAGLDEGDQAILRRLVNRLARVAAVGEPSASPCEVVAEVEPAEDTTGLRGIPSRRPRRPARRG